jgi:Nicotianamine synthase protein
MSPSIVQQIKLLENSTAPATPPLIQGTPYTGTNGKLRTLMDTNQSYKLIEEILDIANDLASLSNLKPSSHVNDLFSQLVSLCIKPWNRKVVEDVLENKRVIAVKKRLREVCAEGEGQLEKYWAQEFLRELQTVPDMSIDRSTRVSGL